MMLYSQSQERSNRFSLALRISVPFIFVLFFWVYVLLKIEEYEYIDISMFILLSLIYVYFTFYMIYQGFKTTLIDENTKTFTKAKIFEILKKKTKKMPQTIVIIGIKNLNDINERYGIEMADKILQNFVLELENFLISKNIFKTPIGRYFGGYFLFALPQKQNYLNHILKEFVTTKKNIQNIEINAVFSQIPSDYSNDLKNTIATAYYGLINDELKIDIFNYETAIINAIDKHNFTFKFQKAKGKNGDIITVIQRLKFDRENMPKYKILNIINKIGYEIKYDLNMLDCLFSGENFAPKNPMIIEISPVSLRNNEFFMKFSQMANKINPQKIIIEFSEISFYNEISRFSEIIKSYKNLGFNFAISHFGGRNSSSQYLKYLSVDFIIYDLEFSKNLTQPKFYEMVKATQNLAKNLGIKTILRFVDKPEIYELGCELGIDYLQGFYIEKPKK